MTTFAAETNLSLVLDAIETGVILYEPVFAPGNDFDPIDFSIPYCNKTVAEMSGLDVHTIKQQRILSLINVDEERRQTLFKQIAEVYKTGQRSVTTVYNTSLDRYFQQTRSKMGNAVLAEVKDITAEMAERKERDHQMAFADQILDQSINGWFTCEALRNDEGEIIDFIITRINPAFTNLLGLTKEETVGKTFLSLFPATKLNGNFQTNCRVFLSGKTERTLVHYVGDGVNAWYDRVASKLESNAILISFADISVLGKAPYGVIHYHPVYDKSGNLVDFVHHVFNEVALQLSGFSFEEMSKMTAYEIADKRKNRRLVDTAVEVVKTGIPARFEYFVESVKKWVDLSLVHYDNGVLMNFIDITPRITQERKVQEAADQFSRIVDASLNAIYVWKAIRDDAGVVVDFEYKLVNKTFEKINRISNSEVIGKTACQLYPSLKGTALFNRYVRVIETGEPIKFEDYYKGEELDMWFEASAVKLSEDEVFISYRDITQQNSQRCSCRSRTHFSTAFLVIRPAALSLFACFVTKAGPSLMDKPS